MKEEKERNEEFLLQQERLKTEGVSREDRIKAAINEFSNLSETPNPRHAYRAWLARLADEKKYKGKYSARAKALQLNRNNKTEPASVSPEQAASEVQVETVA